MVDYIIFYGISIINNIITTVPGILIALLIYEKIKKRF